MYSLYKFLSWFIIYVIPVTYLFIWQNSFSIFDLTYIGVAIIVIYNFYEIGYIQNDTETIKIEKNPTLRLDSMSYMYYEKNKKKIYAIRITVGILFLLTLFLFFDINIIFFILVFLILIIYQLYNNIRNAWILAINFFLVSIRYLAPLMMITSEINKEIIISALFTYPILNLFERLSRIKPNSKAVKVIIPNKERLTNFRVWYYGMILFVSLVLYCFEIFSIFPSILFIFLFLFRLIVFTGVKIGLAPENYLSA